MHLRENQACLFVVAHLLELGMAMDQAEVVIVTTVDMAGIAEMVVDIKFQFYE